MSQSSREARLCAAIYRNYGREAVWSGGGGAQPCVVRVATFDETLEVGRGVALQRAVILHVRHSEISVPSSQDTVQVGSLSYAIVRAPRLEPDGLEWRCEAVEVTS